MDGETRWWRCPRCEVVVPRMSDESACPACFHDDGVEVDRQPVDVLPAGSAARLAALERVVAALSDEKLVEASFLPSSYGGVTFSLEHYRMLLKQRAEEAPDGR